MNSTGDALDSFKDSRYLKEDYVEVRKDLLIAYCLTGYVTLLSFISIKYESFIPTNYLLIMAFSLAIYSCYKKFQQHLEIRKLIAYYIKKNKSNKVGGPQGSGAPSI